MLGFSWFFVCFVCFLFWLEFTYAVHFYFSEENRLMLAVSCKYACKYISVWIHLPMLRQGCLGVSSSTMPSLLADERYPLQSMENGHKKK